ncbi:MAG: OmpW family protein [Hyphomicrobium sp.]|nr:OmpW family protein [Hyphomicrobium sp.]
MTWFKTAALAAMVAGGAAVTPVAAGNYQGDFLVRLQGTVVAPDAGATVFAPGGALAAGADADISTEVIPTLTLTYFLTKNIAAELFCCFAKFDVEGKGTLAGADLGDTWVFPPIVTLQYHFDAMNGFKPYVGAGVQYIAFFSEGDSKTLNSPTSIDNAFGFALQAGFDYEIGNGMYLNADVKKVWLDTEAHWGTGHRADVDVDPWIFSVGLGYRFNLSDVFGSRESASLK